MEHPEDLQAIRGNLVPQLLRPPVMRRWSVNERWGVELELSLDFGRLRGQMVKLMGRASHDAAPLVFSVRRGRIEGKLTLRYNVVNNLLATLLLL
jgi:hypothetical protein